MTVSLLPLSNGHLSLEFEIADLPQVADAIVARFGRFENSDGVVVKTYRFGGCSFAFQNEWDDPCLVSGNAEGDAVLRLLHGDLSSDRV